jgi:hypothetical protein
MHARIVIQLNREQLLSQQQATVAQKLDWASEQDCQAALDWFVVVDQQQQTSNPRDDEEDNCTGPIYMKHLNTVYGPYFPEPNPDPFGYWRACGDKNVIQPFTIKMAHEDVTTRI